MKKVIIINGYAGAGKDAFIDFCEECTLATRLWTSTPAKVALTALGWDGVEKTASIRYVLQKLIEIGECMFNSTQNYLDVELANIDDGLVFIHCREHKKIDAFKGRYNASTLFIDNRKAQDAALAQFQNPSDIANLEEYDYDTIINNNGSLAELKKCAAKYCKDIEDKK